MDKQLTVLILLSLTLLAGCSTPAGQSSDSGGGGSPYDTPEAVSTYTDPDYTGLTYTSKFVPPDGKILLIGGQDRLQITEFVPKWGITPGGFAYYIGVGETNGLWSDKTNQGDTNDIQNAKWLMNTYTNTVLQMAMWMVGKAKGWDDYCKNVTNGTYNASLDGLCHFATNVHVPIFLRIGYEFDGQHNMLEPVEYIDAFRYIVNYIRAKGVHNIAFVWHSYIAPPYNGHAVADWYPGDSYVDWFGASLFWGQVADGNYSSYLDPFVKMAKDHGKPFMIAESCPNGKMSLNKYETWNRWFVPYLNYIRKKNIKAFSYINCNWDKINQFKNDGWSNTRLQDYPLILDRWTNEMRKDVYLKQRNDLYTILGYPGN